MSVEKVTVWKSGEKIFSTEEEAQWAEINRLIQESLIRLEDDADQELLDRDVLQELDQLIKKTAQAIDRLSALRNGAL